MKKTINKISERFTDLVVFLAGSWWAVVLHGLWFFLWLYFSLDLLVLTVIVSLEAIFIGIFILMAEKKEEEIRRKKEARETKTQKEGMARDIALDESQKRSLSEIKKELREIKGKLKQ